MSRARREYLLAVLADRRGCKTKAAVVAGIGRAHLIRLVKQHCPEMLNERARAAAPRPPRRCNVLKLFGRRLGDRGVDLAGAPLAKRYGVR